jgi:ribosomal protein S13
MLNKVVEIQISESWSKNNTVEWRLVNYWGGESRYFINEHDSKELQSLFKFVNDSQNTVNKGDKVYASKASELPRFKLKEFINDNGLKKTSRYNQADVIIINRGHFIQMLKECKFKEYTFIKGDFAESKIVKRDNNDNTYKFFKENLKNNSDKDTVAMVSEWSIQEMEKGNLGKKYPTDKILYDTNTIKIKGTNINLYRSARLSNLMNILFELRKEIMSGKVRIVFDEDMFVTLNKEGIELDDEYLQTLRDMLFSSDKANVKLGFEMMSNLVVNNHMLLSVSFLLNELMHTTKFRPSYYTSSNTNLKSLLKVLSTKGIRWERDWKTFGTGLRNNFKTGKEGEVVKKFLLDNINREFKISNSAAESLVDIVFSTEAQ